jgi:hypothetical protein
MEYIGKDVIQIKLIDCIREQFIKWTKREDYMVVVVANTQGIPKRTRDIMT